MEFAKQFISNDQTVRSNAVQDLKDYLSQAWRTQAKKGGPLVSLIPADEKAFNFLGDDIVEWCTKKTKSKRILRWKRAWRI